MPITMSEANVDGALQAADNFNNTNVDYDATGGATLNTTRTGFLGLGGTEATGAPLAGITPEFVAAYKTALDAYQGEVDAKVDQMTNPDVNQAFKGTGVQTALNNFVEGVKAVAKAYDLVLTDVQRQMADEVKATYGSQDDNLGGQLGNDTSRLQSNIHS